MNNVFCAECGFWMNECKCKDNPLSSHAVLGEVPLELEKAWSTIDVLKHLIWATEYLLNEKDYDGHNHEELNICVKRGKEIIDIIERHYA